MLRRRLPDLASATDILVFFSFYISLSLWVFAARISSYRMAARMALQAKDRGMLDFVADLNTIFTERSAEGSKSSRQVNVI